MSPSKPPTKPPETSPPSSPLISEPASYAIATTSTARFAAEPALYSAPERATPRPTHFAGRYRRLFALIQRVMTTNPEASDEVRRVAAQSTMDANSLFFEWRVQLTTRAGVSQPIEGQVHFPQIFHESRLPGALNEFESILATMVLRPVTAQFQSVLQTFVEKDEPKPSSGPPQDAVLSGKLSTLPRPRRIPGN